LKTVKLKIRGLGGRDSIEKVEYINVFPTPRSSFSVDPAPPQTVVVPEEPAYFTPNDNRPEYTYSWSFGDGDSSNQRSTLHRYQNAGTYDVSLRVTGPNGCSSVDTIKGAVIARGDQVLTIPTAFTPNPNGSNGGVVGGDGHNDVFYPFVQGLTNIQMQIFNRWGTLVYQSFELNRGWDGYYRGKLMPADSYVYRIWASFSNGESQVFVGDVSLIR
jgi:gliding motility-associated-like protein